MLGSPNVNKERITLLFREITFWLSEYIWSTLQTDRPSDRMTDDILIEIPRYAGSLRASCGKNEQGGAQTKDIVDGKMFLGTSTRTCCIRLPWCSQWIVGLELPPASQFSTTLSPRAAWMLVSPPSLLSLKNNFSVATDTRTTTAKTTKVVNATVGRHLVANLMLFHCSPCPCHCCYTHWRLRSLYSAAAAHNNVRLRSSRIVIHRTKFSPTSQPISKRWLGALITRCCKNNVKCNQSPSPSLALTKPSWRWQTRATQKHAKIAPIRRVSCHFTEFHFPEFQITDA